MARKKKTRAKPEALALKEASRSPRVAKSDRMIRFDYLKAEGFRVVSADGFHGGLTPSGKKVHLAIFNERNPIPQSEVYAVNDDGTLGKRAAKQARQAIIRQVEFSVLMDIDKALALQDWLTKVLKTAEVLTRLEATRE